MLKRWVNTSVSEIASLRLRAFPQTCCRVMTARYSRRIWRLIRELLVAHKANQRSSRALLKRRSRSRRVDEDVGIDEAHRPSSSYKSCAPQAQCFRPRAQIVLRQIVHVEPLPGPPPDMRGRHRNGDLVFARRYFRRRDAGDDAVGVNMDAGA